MTMEETASPSKAAAELEAGKEAALTEPPHALAEPEPFPYPVSVADPQPQDELLEQAPNAVMLSAPAAPAAEASAQDASVASIMHNMSWGADGAPLNSLENLGPGANAAGAAPDLGEHTALMQELQARALAQAAAAAGLSPSAAMAALPMLPNLQEGMPDPMDATAVAMPKGEEDGGAEVGLVGAGENPGDQSFTCSVCRKVFKREMNLIFHMTTHRPRQPQTESSEVTSTQPVKCQDCNKEFATKYQAKKHYLRRHFQGDKPFACTKCNKKRFVVKEDLTMHMKSCGNVYVCTCGIRLCSLGALKRHCKYFSHEPESYEPKPEPGVSAMQGLPSMDPQNWSVPGFRPALPRPEDQRKDDGTLMPSMLLGGMGALGGAMSSAMSSAMGGALGGPMAGAMGGPMSAMNAMHAMNAMGAMGMHGGDDPMNVCSHAAMMRSIASAVPAAAQSSHAMGQEQMWQQQGAFDVQGMPLSLVQALRHAQATQQGGYQLAPPDQGQMGQGPLSRFPGYGAPIQNHAAVAALSAAVSAAYTANAPAVAAQTVLSQCQPITSDALGWGGQPGVSAFQPDGNAANV